MNGTEAWGQIFSDAASREKLLFFFRLSSTIANNALVGERLDYVHLWSQQNECPNIQDKIKAPIIPAFVCLWKPTPSSFREPKKANSTEWV